MLLGSAQGPESDGTPAELGEPALQFGLGSIMGKTRHMEDFAPLREESANVGAGVHGTSQDVRVVLGGLGLADEPTKDTSQRYRLLHSTSWRCGRQSLKVEGEVVLDRGAGLDGLHLESRTDIAQHRWAEWQRLGVVLLPALVFGTEVECAGVLEVRRKHGRLVPSFTGKLHSKVPSIERDEHKVEVLRGQVFRSEGIEPVDRISEGAGIADMLPRQSREACCWPKCSSVKVRHQLHVTS